MAESIYNVRGRTDIFYILLLLVSFATCAVGSLSGIGGGIILKPVLDAVTGMSAAAVNFMSGCTVLSMSVLSLIRYPKKEVKVDKKRGIPLALGAAAGGIIGKELFEVFLSRIGDSSNITVIQSIIIFLLTLFVLIYMGVKNKLRTVNVQNPYVCVLIGTVLGMLSAFLGIGGGPINIAAISFFLGMDAKTTALHSIMAIFISQLFSFGSTVITGAVPVFDFFLLIPLIVGAAAGAVSGASLMKKISNKTVELLFICVLFLVMIITVINIIRAS